MILKLTAGKNKRHGTKFSGSTYVLIGACCTPTAPTPSANMHSKRTTNASGMFHDLLLIDAPMFKFDPFSENDSDIDLLLRITSAENGIVEPCMSLRVQASLLLTLLTVSYRLKTCTIRFWKPSLSRSARRCRWARKTSSPIESHLSCLSALASLAASLLIKTARTCHSPDITSCQQRIMLWMQNSNLNECYCWPGTCQWLDLEQTSRALNRLNQLKRGFKASCAISMYRHVVLPRHNCGQVGGTGCLALVFKDEIR